MSTPNLWKRYQQHLCGVPALGLTLDVSRMRFEASFLEQMAPPLQRAFEAMDALERGAIANPDEKRMVGHYWLRAPDLAPTPAIAAEIRNTLAEIKRFAAAVHDGTVRTPAGRRFTQVLCVGIGGSALGPMFVADALGNPGGDRMKLDFIDNTDPDGIARARAGLAGRLGETLCVVSSKSGGTPDTRNGMLLVAEAYRQAGLDFPPHAVAVRSGGGWPMTRHRTPRRTALASMGAHGIGTAAAEEEAAAGVEAIPGARNFAIRLDVGATTSPSPNQFC